MDNLHGRIPRKICQTVLDELATEKHLSCKEYGKAKVYLANQDLFPETSKDELNELDEQIQAQRKLLEERQNSLKSKKHALNEITQSLSNKALLEKLAKLKEDNIAREKQLSDFQGGSVVQVSEEEVDQVKVDFARYHKEWRVRRRACFEIVDMISESVDKTRKEFTEMVGLETDEDYGVSFADFNSTI